MFKPMLAPHEDPMSYPDYFKKLKYPLLCSPKYDGVRCIIKNHIAYSRTFKPIPSRQVQDQLNDLEHFDGELIVGEPTDYNVYNRTQSHVMSIDKPNVDLRYYVFDYTHPDFLNSPFTTRFLKLCDMSISNISVFIVEQEYIESKIRLLEYEEECLERGFEGIMMKSCCGYYKQGRGTFNQGLIYKLKRFQDDEGVIVGFEEGKSNQNVQERDELGYAKRSTAKAGMVPTDTLGKFIVNFKGMEIEVAPGSFNHDERKHIWQNQLRYQGSYLKFRHFTHGVKDKPRFPRAIGFRDKIDFGD
jgi:DNA ligase-1